eukprot:m.1271648 g.1271648  ORF g.1271648 m.1271648 type:complete len:62 (-) comp24750_c0_seq43:625-810(-)
MEYVRPVGELECVCVFAKVLSPYLHPVWFLTTTYLFESIDNDPGCPQINHFAFPDELQCCA